MKKIICSLVLLLGACAPAEFSPEFCNEQCSQCPIEDCEFICGLLDEGMQTATCRDESNELWNCATCRIWPWN